MQMAEPKLQTRATAGRGLHVRVCCFYCVFSIAEEQSHPLQFQAIQSVYL